jgi:hypothetical protein
MASTWERFRAWWNKDKVELAEEETGISEAGRAAAEESVEGQWADRRAGDEWLRGAGGADFDRDSETPRDLAP